MGLQEVEVAEAVLHHSQQAAAGQEDVNCHRPELLTQHVHVAALQELADADTAPPTAPSRKRLPKGTSDYQAAWITEAAGPDDLSSGSDDEDAALPQQQGHSMEDASEAGGSMEDDDETDDMLVSALCGGLWNTSN